VVVNEVNIADDVLFSLWDSMEI